MPHGLPGVASSMNRPNSGWKCGGSSPALINGQSLCSCPVKQQSILTVPHWRRSQTNQLATKPHPERETSEFRPVPEITEPSWLRRQVPPPDIRPSNPRTKCKPPPDQYSLLVDRTSSPHSRTSRSLPRARRQFARSCCIASQVMSCHGNQQPHWAVSAVVCAYLNSPLAHLMGPLLCLRPFERSSKSTRGRLATLHALH